MKNWVKGWLGITKLEAEIRALNIQIEYHKKFVIEKVADLKEYTRVDADVGIRGNNTIILTGVYHKQGFVQFYDIDDGGFQRLVDMMRSMKDHALIRHIDSPPVFHGVFEL